MTEKECRICFETETETENENDFINPCLCDGTSKWVHENCLQEWRRINIGCVGNKHCMECKYKYKLEFQFEKERFKISCLSKQHSIGYIMSIFILSFPVSYGIYALDTYNDYLSIKIFTFNNNQSYRRIERSFTSGIHRSLYYDILTINIYANFFYFFFLFFSMFKITRKKLYLKLLYSKYIQNLIIINNLFYFSAIIPYFSIDFFYLFEVILTLYNIYLTQNLLKISNSSVERINTEFNREKILNYIESDVSDVTDETKCLNLVLDE